MVIYGHLWLRRKQNIMAKEENSSFKYDPGKCKSYTDRLKFLNLPTLKYRRCRGDMIEVYKIINGIMILHASHI